MSYLNEMTTKEQRANLKTLATHLRKVHSAESRLKFGMNEYMALPEGSIDPLIEDATKEVPCGSSACAIGHGPDAGIAAGESEGWAKYAHRVFGFQDGLDSVGNWMFASDWRMVDDTALGAALRIEYVLEHGDAPEEHYLQRMGSVPYIFAEQVKS